MHIQPLLAFNHYTIELFPSFRFPFSFLFLWILPAQSMSELFRAVVTVAIVALPLLWVQAHVFESVFEEKNFSTIAYSTWKAFRKSSRVVWYSSVYPLMVFIASVVRWKWNFIVLQYRIYIIWCAGGTV